MVAIACWDSMSAILSWRLHLSHPAVYNPLCAWFDMSCGGMVRRQQVYDFLASAGAKYGIGFWKPGSGIIHQVGKFVTALLSK